MTLALGHLKGCVSTLKSFSFPSPLDVAHEKPYEDWKDVALASSRMRS